MTFPCLGRNLESFYINSEKWTCGKSKHNNVTKYLMFDVIQSSYLWEEVYWFSISWYLLVLLFLIRIRNIRKIPSVEMEFEILSVWDFRTKILDIVVRYSIGKKMFNKTLKFRSQFLILLGYKKSFCFCRIFLIFEKILSLNYNILPDKNYFLLYNIKYLWDKYVYLHFYKNIYYHCNY